jgi:hypothetical protein
MSARPARFARLEVFDASPAGAGLAELEGTAIFIDCLEFSERLRSATRAAKRREPRSASRSPSRSSEGFAVLSVRGEEAAASACQAWRRRAWSVDRADLAHALRGAQRLRGWAVSAA